MHCSYGAALDMCVRASRSLLGLVVALAPCAVDASSLLLAPTLIDPETSTSLEQPAALHGRGIDPEVPTAVPSPPNPEPPVIDPREAYIERRLQGYAPSDPEPPPEPPEPPDEPARGLGMIIPGALLVGVGAFWTGVGFWARSIPADGFCIDSCEDKADEPNPFTGAVAFSLAAVSFAASAGLLVGGSLRHKNWRAWKARQPPPPPPSSDSSPSPKRGIGMMAAGASFAGPAPLYLILVVGAGASRGDPGTTALWSVAGASFVAGVTLVAVGARRHVKYRRWKHDHTLVPTAGRTAYGTWIAGVALRF